MRPQVYFWLDVFIVITVLNLPESLSKNATDEIKELPPLEFPDTNSSYHVIISNATVRQNLTALTKHGKTITLGGSLEETDPKSEVEYIENGENTEDTRENRRRLHEQAKGVDSHPMVQGQLAAILAGIFVLLAVIGYIGLLLFRRFLENRYGNREMLINEEDFTDFSERNVSPQHFSITE